MAVLPDIFAENTDADNEHLPANSVGYIIYSFVLPKIYILVINLYYFYSAVNE
jgi:hypothetical protein